MFPVVHTNARCSNDLAELSIALSPCPNDTFIFYALVHGLVPSAPPFDVTYADVDITNTAARTGAYDIVKVSYAALPWLLDQYTLVPCGGAVGRGCGPLVVSQDSCAQNLEGLRVAIPGEHTTAYLLLRLWAQRHPPATITVVPFADIMPAVAAGQYDAGLVIHEARFTVHQYGLHTIVDLGEWWERKTDLPIPLGAIIARHGIDISSVTEWIKASLRHAWAHPKASHEFVLLHANQTAPEVIRRHIDLYVNTFTENLGDEGYEAARALWRYSDKAGLLPPELSHQWERVGR